MEEDSSEEVEETISIKLGRETLEATKKILEQRNLRLKKT